jgi:hypothetical protein
MRQKWFVAMLLVGFGVVAAGCASPPQADIDSAKAALQQATSAGASEYAADSLKAAQDADAALDAELKAQQDKFSMFRSYTKAAELATAAKLAGEKAQQDAAAGKEAAKTAATGAIDEAKSMLTQAQEMLSKAPKGKGTAADLEAMKTDLTGAESTIGEAESAFTAERYLDAKAKAEAAKTAAGNVTAAVEAAIAARKGRK